ncbi:MAG: ShlB/FhaC/HecB family hemolysin secretion/activation protein, partial [Leptolyngbyaceae cyanobacterium bins.59]|nr:ShlB/FhaC/HecB family hemolysin secretion/activation protein [Leptolyngbyaceae cyanobacterium bins.59]
PLLPSPAGPFLPDSPETITVERFEIVGSTVFSPEDLATVTRPFVGRPISLTELFEARSAVTQLYFDRGYITSGALIPPQRLQGGVVQIQVIEGELEGIQVSGTNRLDSGYIRSRLAVAVGKPLNREHLLQALQLLQLDPLIATISADLTAGTRPGKSLLLVKVTEGKTFNANLIYDNARSPSVGSDRRRIQLTEANLLGLGDSVSVGYTNTDGSDSLDMGYTLPISPYNSTLTLNYGSSSARVIERPFNILDILSSSRYYEVTLRQPLYRTPAQEFAFGITGSYRESEASFNILGERISFGARAANDGKLRVTALRLFQEWTDRNTEQVLAMRSQFSIGLETLGSTLNPAPPDGRFFTWRGQAQYVRLLAPDTLLLLRSDLQVADRPLVGLEQFGIGGLDSVRGYRQDLLLLDNGFFGSAEVRVPLIRIPEVGALFQVVPFIDGGTGWNLASGSDAQNSLVSVGLGLRLQMSNLTARLEWGIPLISVNREAKTWQENGLHFSIIYTPLSF